MYVNLQIMEAIQIYIYSSTTNQCVVSLVNCTYLYTAEAQTSHPVVRVECKHNSVMKPHFQSSVFICVNVICFLCSLINNIGLMFDRMSINEHQIMFPCKI